MTIDSCFSVCAGKVSGQRDWLCRDALSYQYRFFKKGQAVFKPTMS